MRESTDAALYLWGPGSSQFTSSKMAPGFQHPPISFLHLFLNLLSSFCFFFLGLLAISRKCGFYTFISYLWHSICECHSYCWEPLDSISALRVIYLRKYKIFSVESLVECSSYSSASHIVKADFLKCFLLASKHFKWYNSVLHQGNPLRLHMVEVYPLL